MRKETNSISNAKLAQKDIEDVDAHSRLANAAAASQETQTQLQKQLARQVLCYLWTWSACLLFFFIAYLVCLVRFQVEIPKEIMLAALASTTAKTGLVSYILKGLFGNRQ